MFSTKVVEKIQIHILGPVPFSFCPLYDFEDKQKLWYVYISELM
jgi:hypothetical protein